MSETNDLFRHYREVRQRLRYPSNAVPDNGIDLKRPPAGAIIRERPSSATVTSQGRELSPPPAPPQQETTPPTIHTVCPISSKPYSASTAPIGLTFTSSVHLIAHEFGLTATDILSRRRLRRFTHVRHIAIHVLIKHYQKISKSAIGRRFGLDHTSVIYADRKAASVLEGDPDLKERVLSLEAKLALLYPSSPPAHSQPHLGPGQEGDVPEQRIPPMDQAG